jgi:hypothetical protein
MSGIPLLNFQNENSSVSLLNGSKPEVRTAEQVPFTLMLVVDGHQPTFNLVDSLNYLT